MLVAVALVAAMIGGSVGALIMHSGSAASNQNQTAQAPNPTSPQSNGAYNNAAYDTASNQVDRTSLDQYVNERAAELKTPEEQAAYRMGFTDGFLASRESRNAYAPANVVYRAPYARYHSGHRVYYDYEHRSGRTFWQKHRDKLTVAIGTGTGAAVGALIGGGKGAGIGALVGAGSSALWTYKLRHR
jgi:hypothetical protein